jgi:hypothetical protein
MTLSPINVTVTVKFLGKCYIPSFLQYKCSKFKLFRHEESGNERMKTSSTSSNFGLPGSSTVSCIIYGIKFFFRFNFWSKLSGRVVVDRRLVDPATSPNGSHTKQ